MIQAQLRTGFGQMFRKGNLLRVACLQPRYIAYASGNLTAHTGSLKEGVLKGERWALSRAITLVESTNDEKRRQGQLLLHEFQQHTVQERSLKDKPTIRLGSE